MEELNQSTIHSSIHLVACSTIDHIAASPRMLSGLISAGVVHDGSNLSNHSPIYAKFEVGKMDLRTQEYVDKSHVLWGMASEEAKNTFKGVFADKLIAINPPIECTDIHCTSEQHIEKLEEYTTSVLQAMEIAGTECLPSTASNKKKKSKILPGWTEYVQPYADESKFWHRLLTSAGKPLHGELFAIMKSKKGQYKYAVRKLKNVLTQLVMISFYNPFSEMILISLMRLRY